MTRLSSMQQYSFLQVSPSNFPVLGLIKKQALKKISQSMQNLFVFFNATDRSIYFKGLLDFAQNEFAQNEFAQRGRYHYSKVMCMTS